jgi:hypothetical protein
MQVLLVVTAAHVVCQGTCALRGMTSLPDHGPQLWHQVKKGDLTAREFIPRVSCYARINERDTSKPVRSGVAVRWSEDSPPQLSGCESTGVQHTKHQHCDHRKACNIPATTRGAVVR